MKGQNIFAFFILALSFLFFAYKGGLFEEILLMHQNGFSEIEDPYDQDLYESLLEKFTVLVENDEEILHSLQNNQHFTQRSAQKIRNFFKENQHFRQALENNLNHPKSPKCFKELNKKQKGKLVQIIIDHMDFRVNFNVDESELTGDKILEKIKHTVLEQQDLEKDVIKCYERNKDKFSKLSWNNVLSPEQDEEF